MAIQNKLTRREKLIQKTITIDNDLYERIEKLSKTIYDESVSKIINACIFELAETENINIYANKNELLVKHTIIFRQNALIELERLHKKYRLPAYKLVNISIHNVIDELESCQANEKIV